MIAGRGPLPGGNALGRPAPRPGAAGLRALRILWLLAALALMAASCACSKSDPVKERARTVSKPRGDIVIAAAGSWTGQAAPKGLLNGIRLATDQINASGGILGRQVRLVVKDDEGTLAKGMLIAEEIAGDTGVAAVVGHFYSFITRPCSSIYERAGVLHVSPVSYVMSAPGRNNAFVIQTHVKADAIARALADYARAKGYRRLAVSYVYDDFGMHAANHFEKTAREEGLSVVDVIPFTLSDASFDMAFAKWKKMDFDAMVLIGHRNALTPYFVAASKLGMNRPVLTFNDWQALERLKLPMEGAVAISYFDPGVDTPQMRLFLQSYRNTYRTNPDEYAAQGYEAVMLIRDAMTKAGTADPAAVAAAMRSMKDWLALDGVYGFGEDGKLQGDDVDLLVMRGGVFERVTGP